MTSTKNETFEYWLFELHYTFCSQFFKKSLFIKTFKLFLRHQAFAPVMSSLLYSLTGINHSKSSKSFFSHLSITDHLSFCKISACLAPGHLAILILLLGLLFLFSLFSSNSPKVAGPWRTALCPTLVPTSPWLFQPCSRFQVHVLLCIVPKFFPYFGFLQNFPCRSSKYFLDLMSTPPTQDIQQNDFFQDLPPAVISLALQISPKTYFEIVFLL